MANGVFSGILKHHISVNNAITKKSAKSGRIPLVKLANGVLSAIFMYNGGNVWVYLKWRRLPCAKNGDGYY
ncbi:hypothetical protein LPJCM8341_21890 [Lactiplantibacillus plantarum subsp. plantarum]|nr:hypothetical protein LPL02_26800 [Lactiplantibacillus plantarum subsp. plantarum]GIU65004.1 hypothetical protein LPJCM8341_21890 [Lactiplantibacillus plantarum subsp. plantarum]